MKLIWGEATASSAPFYERILKIGAVRDLFIIRQGPMRRFREGYSAKLKRRLAETEWRMHY